MTHAPELLRPLFTRLRAGAVSDQKARSDAPFVAAA